MQHYDHSRQSAPRHALHRPGPTSGGSGIPGMRVAHERSAGRSATPIYDSLCAEYRRLFRALPGDRTDEEELWFPGFGDVGGGYVTFPVRAGYGAYGAHTGYAAHEEPGAPALPPAQRETGPGERPPGS